ncbi:MAG: TlpA disulfide reductase family protein [Rubripirellula sp.]
MKTRFILTVLFCWALVTWTLEPQSVAAKEFGIGSKAPALDIEHWIQDGNGFFKPVTKFEEGKVYVVEFWATWCGPCIQSMPHLSATQTKYRGRDVQIISVSDETVDEVKELLLQKNEQVGKTFADITSAYSLTTDPDRSVYEDYMDASGQQGIPTAFIVGKTGTVEWIGHPMEMDEPLEAIVTDSWDREAFKEELKSRKALDESMQKISMMAGRGQFEEALKIVEEQSKAAKSKSLKDHWDSVRNGVKLAAGKVDDDVVAYFASQLEEIKESPQAVTQFAYSLYGAAQQGSDISKIAGNVLVALKAQVEKADPQLKPIMLNTAALLESATGKLDDAIKSQQAAIDVTENERQKQRMVLFLEELKERTKPEAAKAE